MIELNERKPNREEYRGMSNKKVVLIMICVTVAVVIVGALVIMFTSKSKKKDSAGPSHPASDQKEMIILNQSPEAAAPTGTGGMDFSVSFPSMTGELVPTDVQIKRVRRLVPDSNESTVPLQSCAEGVCYPKYEMYLDSDEALVVLDMILSTQRKAIRDEDFEKAPYIDMSNGARISTDDGKYPIKNLKYDSGTWLMMNPVISASGYNNVTQMFFAKIPRTATSAEFQFARWKKVQFGPTEDSFWIVYDLGNPMLRVPLEF